MKITKNTNKIRKIIYSYIFVLVIINSMIPNSKNCTSLAPFKSILPGIEKIYTKNTNEERNNNTYSFKIIETLKKYVIH